MADPIGFQKIIEAATQFLPADVKKSIDKVLKGTRPPEEDLEEEMLSYRGYKTTPQVNTEADKQTIHLLDRLEKALIAVGMGKHDSEKISQDLKQAYDLVLGIIKKEKMKLVDSTSLGETQFVKMAKIIDHPKFEVNIANQDEAEALLNERGLVEGDFIFYRPKENEAKAILAYMKDGDAHRVEIDVDPLGHYSVTENANKTFFTAENAKLTNLIQSKIPSYKEPVPLTGSDLKEGFVKAGTEIAYNIKQALMTDIAKSRKSEFEKAKTSEGEVLYESNAAQARESLAQTGDFVFTSDKTDPAKVILLMKYGDKIKEFPITINREGLCEIEVQDGVTARLLPEDVLHIASERAADYIAQHRREAG